MVLVETEAIAIEPSPVAVKAVLVVVSRSRPPLKATVVAASLPVMEIPAPSSSTKPLRVPTAQATPAPIAANTSTSNTATGSRGETSACPAVRLALEVAHEVKGGRRFEGRGELQVRPCGECFEPSLGVVPLAGQRQVARPDDFEPLLQERVVGACRVRER